MNISEFSTKRRVEILRQLDRRLADMKVVSRGTMWAPYGLKATVEQTQENWERIAADDEEFSQAILYYAMCTLEPYTLGQFGRIG